MSLREGPVDPGVAAELPGLRLVSGVIEASATRSPPGLRQRLRVLSDGFRGAQAVMLRQQPIPAAYRVFFRHIGLDPDVDRIPVEALAVERLRHGGFKSRNTLDDALTVTLLETSVPLWALDEDGVAGELTIRPGRPGEVLGTGEYPARVPEGRLVVADADGPVSVLFGDVVAGRGVTSATTRIRLFSVLVAGVPEIHVEEAFWQCEEILTGEGGDL